MGREIRAYNTEQVVQDYVLLAQLEACRKINDIPRTFHEIKKLRKKTELNWFYIASDVFGPEIVIRYIDSLYKPEENG